MIKETAAIISESHLTINDVLCGRGTKHVSNAGNKMYHTLVKQFIQEYFSAEKKADKTIISIAIVDAVKNASPPGRFLSNHGYGKCWREIPDQKAREKTSQLLREAVMIGKTNTKTMYQKKKVDLMIREKFKAARHKARRSPSHQSKGDRPQRPSCPRNLPRQGSRSSPSAVVPFPIATAARIVQRPSPLIPSVAPHNAAYSKGVLPSLKGATESCRMQSSSSSFSPTYFAPVTAALPVPVPRMVQTHLPLLPQAVHHNTAYGKGILPSLKEAAKSSPTSTTTNLFTPTSNDANQHSPLPPIPTIPTYNMIPQPPYCASRPPCYPMIASVPRNNNAPSYYTPNQMDLYRHHLSSGPDPFQMRRPISSSVGRLQREIESWAIKPSPGTIAELERYARLQDQQQERMHGNMNPMTMPPNMMERPYPDTYPTYRSHMNVDHTQTGFASIHCLMPHR